MPRHIEPPVEALKPWCCESLVMREPIVSMIFQPPDIVPMVFRASLSPWLSE